MNKSQFNIKISKDLLIRLKRRAMMSGKSLTEYITDLINNDLSENEIEQNNLSLVNDVKDFEERLVILESIVGNREYLSKKLTPFTNKEAINCTKYMRGVFYKELEKRNYDDKAEAFDELLKSVKAFDDLDDSSSYRLREIILSDNPNPYSGKELNELSGDDKCNCPIRKGLISWTGSRVIPSQQEICDKGENLLAFS